MAQQNERQKNAEKRVTQELANQASEDPGSAEEDQAKDRRAEAEKELQNAS